MRQTEQKCEQMNQRKTRDGRVANEKAPTARVGEGQGRPGTESGVRTTDKFPSFDNIPNELGGRPTSQPTTLMFLLNDIVTLALLVPGFPVSR